jgi:hypothetical protein
VEVSDDQLTLRVFFLGKAPAEIDVPNVRIEGGSRVRDIRVRDVRVHREARRGRDDWMDVVVDRPGDFASYTLRLIDPGPPERPMAGFDQRYASVAFSFKVGCPSDLDCADEPSCAPAITAAPDINYLARDYTGFRQLLLDRLSVIMPEWRERHVPDVGIALVELLAYTGDYLSQYQDAVATEAYLETARLRISVRRHARLVDYRLFEGSNARAWLTIDARTDFDLDLGLASFVTRYAGAREGRSQILWRELSQLTDARYVVFEPLWPPRSEVMPIHAAHSRIELYTWGDGECCLPRARRRPRYGTPGFHRDRHRSLTIVSTAPVLPPRPRLHRREESSTRWPSATSSSSRRSSGRAPAWPPMPTLGTGTRYGSSSSGATSIGST